MVDGEPIDFAPFLSSTDRLNTVTAQYSDPDQFWNVSSAPMRRDYADVLAEGPFEIILPLDAVFLQRQAQRIAEIRRREGRLERVVSITLPARFSNIEVGDWGTWTSARYLGGSTVTFRVTRDETAIGRTKRLTLRETNSSVYAWNPAVDEIEVTTETPERPDYEYVPKISLLSERVDDLEGEVAGLAVPTTPKGYQQFLDADLASVASLTVPSGATRAVIQNNGSQPVRWRDDGVNPTSTTGQRILSGEEKDYRGTLSAVRLIREASGASLDVLYYGS